MRRGQKSCREQGNTRGRVAAGRSLRHLSAAQYSRYRVGTTVHVDLHFRTHREYTHAQNIGDIVTTPPSLLRMVRCPPSGSWHCVRQIPGKLALPLPTHTKTVKPKTYREIALLLVHDAQARSSIRQALSARQEIGGANGHLPFLRVWASELGL